MKKKTIFGIIAIILIAVVGFIFIQGNANKTNAIAVRTGEITKKTIVEQLSTTGTLIPDQSQSLTGTGTVITVNVMVGDLVEKDQVLATYDNGFQLIAPFKGTITQVNIKERAPDTAAQFGKPSIQIDNLATLKVQVQLANSEAAAVKVNQKVEIKNGGQTYEGVVAEKDPLATSTQTATGSNASLGAIVTFKTTPDNLFAGFDIDLDITTNTANDAIALPIEALTYSDQNEPIVFVIKEGLAKRSKIEIGIQSDKLVEVKSGLKVGDSVILSPTSDIKNNTEVTKE